MDAFLLGSVCRLHEDQLLDTSIIHGDGTTTAAKKGGDNLGFSGHKKMKGDKVVAFCDRNCNVIAPFVSAPGNRNESPLLREALPRLTRIAKAIGLDFRDTIVSLDGVYDCRANRKAIFNRGMTPNINANPRGRKTPKRGRKPLFDPAIFDERFSTIARVFGWEGKFRRLLLRFQRLSHLHYPAHQDSSERHPLRPSFHGLLRSARAFPTSKSLGMAWDGCVRLNGILANPAGRAAGSDRPW
jgi:hypothetical protein